MRVSTLDFFQRTVSNFSNQRDLINNTQAQISSGKRILSPADDPIGAMQSLNMHYEVSKVTQFTKNVDAAESILEYEDSILDGVNKLYQRVKELAIQSGNASLSFTDRAAIATEITERLNELKSLANSRAANGDFLFSGYNVYNDPVVVNSAGTYLYRGDEGQRSTMIGESTVVAISDPGKDLFFNIPTNKIRANTANGLVSITTTLGTQVPSGSLPTLVATDLKLNDYAIPFSISDGVSTTDSAASAIAIANAINSTFSLHGIKTKVNPNVVDLGIFTPGVISAGELTLNGVAIVDPSGTESSLISSINSLAELTGITASQPLGAGTAIVLTANDGRNIQLQTAGGATATFANFNMTAGALDNVVKSTITLVDHHPVAIGGSLPSDAGLTAGVYSPSLNTGSGIISSAKVIDDIADVTASYSIIFNAGGTTFNIVNDTNPSQAIAGFSNVPYVSGKAIEFEGISVVINGTPNANDVFAVELEEVKHQNVFVTIQDLIASVVGSQTSEQLSYEIGLALENLDNAELMVLQTRAKIGARLNIIGTQRAFNQSLQYIAEKNLSLVEDLDYSKAITNLTQYTFTLEAAQQSFVKIQSLSLFYFLR